MMCSTNVGPNIRLGWKTFPGANILAYCDEEKSFVILSPERNMAKLDLILSLFNETRHLFE
jgi:hypothetical protein